MIGFKLPDTAGWSVEVETERVSPRTGKHYWDEVITTTDEQKARKIYDDLKKAGKTVRIYECIF